MRRFASSVRRLSTGTIVTVAALGSLSPTHALAESIQSSVAAFAAQPQHLSPVQAEVVVPGGGLTISTTLPPGAPGTMENPLSLGEAILDPSGHCLVTQSTLPLVTITQLGVGVGFTVSVAASDLVVQGVSAPDSTQVIDAQNIGVALTSVSSNLPASMISTFAVDAPSECVLPGTPGSLGAGKGMHPLLATTIGPGTVSFIPVASVSAPVSTRAGVFVGTLTYTVI